MNRGTYPRRRAFLARMSVTSHRRAMPRSRKQPGLPSKEQVIEFIQSSDKPAGKRDIAKAFGLKGEERIALKRLLRDMADEGLIDGKKTAFHRMGGVPKVTVLRVVDVDEGEAIAIPDAWSPDDGAPPPRIRLVESKRHAALKAGDRVLARTEETGSGWTARPMKKLPARGEGLLGVVELDGSGKPWLAPTDKRTRTSSPIADLGGAEPGQLVLAEPGRTPRSGVKVIEVLGDPLAPKSFSLIAIHKHGIPHVFREEALAEAELAAKLPLSEEDREDLRHLPIVAIDPADARGQLLHRVRRPAAAGLLGARQHPVAGLERGVLLALDQPQPRRRGAIVGAPGIGNGDCLALLDVDHAQHGDLGHAAHAVEGGLLAVDQAFVGHVAQQPLERDLLLPLEPERLGDLALAGGGFGRLDELDDLLLAGQAGHLART